MLDQTPFVSASVCPSLGGDPSLADEVAELVATIFLQLQCSSKSHYQAVLMAVSKALQVPFSPVQISVF